MCTAGTYRHSAYRRAPAGRRRPHRGSARAGLAAAAALLALGLTACGGQDTVGARTGGGGTAGTGGSARQGPSAGTSTAPGGGARTGGGGSGDAGPGASHGANSGAAGAGSAAPSGKSRATATSGAGPASSGTCAAKQLDMTLGRPDPAAGNVHYDLAFTNKGPGSCTLRGFPGVSVRRGDGAQIGTPATHEGGAHGAVRLGAGQTAHATLHTLNRGVRGGRCWESPAMLQAYPPGSKESMTLRSSAPRICGGTFSVTSLSSATGGSPEG